MYQLTKPSLPSTESFVVKRLADNAFIPFDPANTDFIEYQRWLSEGNTPEPADEPTAE